MSELSRAKFEEVIKATQQYQEAMNEAATKFHSGLDEFLSKDEFGAPCDNALKCQALALGDVADRGVANAETMTKYLDEAYNTKYQSAGTSAEEKKNSKEDDLQGAGPTTITE
ncbi:hypothetical protein HDV00_011515 [Rhizophlyctis rosea]|nr:hypothetical protein HDV00_011515 [Rhizophlyctis rosea]